MALLERMNPLLADDGAKPGKNTAPKNSRREARETVLKALYAYEMTQEGIKQILDDVCDNFTEPATQFIHAVVQQTIAHQMEMDVLIKARAQNWEFERIALIDRILMRMALCEILFFEDIPPKVSINEMIEISKRYSTDKSSKFINGILDTIYEDLKSVGRITKTGRGIIES